MNFIARRHIMKTLKVLEEWFVPWILDDYSATQLMEAWGRGD